MRLILSTARLSGGTFLPVGATALGSTIRPIFFPRYHLVGRIGSVCCVVWIPGLSRINPDNGIPGDCLFGRGGSYYGRLWLCCSGGRSCYVRRGFPRCKIYRARIDFAYVNYGTWPTG